MTTTVVAANVRADRPLQARNGIPLQARRLRLAATLAAGLTLSACAAGLPSLTTAGFAGTAPKSTTPADASAPAPTAAATPASGPQRELSAAEKKVIMDAVEFNLKDPDAARYHWTRFPARTDDSSRNYCATVDAKSPYAAYNGKQAYIVEVSLASNQIVGATMGLIAGGKDAGIVAKMCAKYGLSPY